MKFKEEKLISIENNINKVKIGKLYYFFDSESHFKDCIYYADVERCIFKGKLGGVDTSNEAYPFTPAGGTENYKYIYPVKVKKPNKSEQVSEDKTEVKEAEKHVFDLNKLIWNGNKEKAVAGKRYFAFTNINQFAQDFEKEDVVIQTFDFCELNDEAVTIRPFIVHDSITHHSDDVQYLYPVPGEEY